LTLPAEITHDRDEFVRSFGKLMRVERKMEDVAAIIEHYDIIRGEAAKV